MAYPKPSPSELKNAFDLRGVRWREHRKCNNGRSRWENGLRAATVHHTAGKNSADYLAMFRYGGANCVITNGNYNPTDGEAIILCWGDAFHSGRGGPWKGVASTNSLHLVSWGIEIESLGTKPDITPAQEETVGRMLAALVDLGMPLGNIHRHADWTDGTPPVGGFPLPTRGRKIDTNKTWYPTQHWVDAAKKYEGDDGMATPEEYAEAVWKRETNVTMPDGTVVKKKMGSMLIAAYKNTMPEGATGEEE